MLAIRATVTVQPPCPSFSSHEEKIPDHEKRGGDGRQSADLVVPRDTGRRMTDAKQNNRDIDLLAPGVLHVHDLEKLYK